MKLRPLMCMIVTITVGCTAMAQEKEEFIPDGFFSELLNGVILDDPNGVLTTDDVAVLRDRNVRALKNIRPRTLHHHIHGYHCIVPSGNTVHIVKDLSVYVTLEGQNGGVPVLNAPVLFGYLEKYWEKNK